MFILDFFNMKTLLQLLLAQKLISSKCVLFQNNLLQGDTAPLRIDPLVVKSFKAFILTLNLSPIRDNIQQHLFKRHYRPTLKILKF